MDWCNKVVFTVQLQLIQLLADTDITLLRGMLTMQASKGLNINYVGI